MKLARLEKWVVVQLTNLVVSGQVFDKKNVPQGFNYYTGQIYGIKENILVTSEGIYELGLPDKVWIQTNDAKVLDAYKI